MEQYWKLIGALVGNVVAIVLVWASFQFPGVVECVAVADPDLPEACTLFGFDQVQITAGIMFVLNSAFVYFFPANRP